MWLRLSRRCLVYTAASDSGPSIEQVAESDADTGPSRLEVGRTWTQRSLDIRCRGARQRSVLLSTGD
jgi:hypothetical protein